MHLSSFVTGLALSFSLVSSVLSAPPAMGPSVQPKPNGNGRPTQIIAIPSTTACYTTRVSKLFNKPTTRWLTSTTSCTQTSTVAITSTITPVSTTTVTAFTTQTSTAPATTNTAIVTTTSTSTDVATTLSISTSISTVTITTSIVSTYVVPTTAGFIPIETSIPGATYKQAPPRSKKKRSGTGNTNRKSDLKTQNGLSSARTGVFGSALNSTFPGDVRCHLFVGKCSTLTSTIVKTSTANPVVTTQTSTLTVVTTTTPGASTTMTTTATTVTSSTSTVTSTTTVTSTEISTSIISATTSYAACSTEYMASYYNNGAFYGADADRVSQNIVFATAGETSPYDCCVLGLLNPVGALFGLSYKSPGTSDMSGSCVIFEDNNGVCSGQNDEVANTLWYSQNPQDFPGFAVGNLNCGTWNRVEL